MTVDIQTAPVENKPSDKELNFRALEAKYQKQLEQERSERLEIQRQYEERLAKIQKDDDEPTEPYVDHKNLEKKLAKFNENTSKQTKSEIQKEVQQALEVERNNAWMESNKDFYDVMNHAEKLMSSSPDLAKTILKMPDTFERQKLVYANVKALGLHKPPENQPSIQQQIDSNRKNYYYQPTGVSAAPYAAAGDFSPTGQKQAYEKMQELKSRLRI